MTTIEIDRTISEAFSGGEVLCRELRLTAEEADYVRAHYAADMTDLGECWYQLQFKRGLLS